MSKMMTIDPIQIVRDSVTSYLIPFHTELQYVQISKKETIEKYIEA